MLWRHYFWTGTPTGRPKDIGVRIVYWKWCDNPAKVTVWYSLKPAQCSIWPDVSPSGVFPLHQPPPFMPFRHHSSTPPLQAQLVDLRSELTEAKAERAAIEREVHDQLLQLHALQLQLHAKQGQAEDSDSIKDRLVSRRRKSCSQHSDSMN